MSSTLGPVSYKMTDEDPFLGREMQKTRQFSEHTMEVIDEEVNSLLRTAADKAHKMLQEHWDDVEALTRKLIEHEELDRNQIEEVIGESIHKKSELSSDNNAEDSNSESD